MADSNRMALRFLEEVTWGTTPASAGTNVRITSESLGQSTTFQASQELRSDRAVPRGARTDIQAEGDISFELSYGNLDSLFEGLCGATAWPTEETITAATLSVANADNSFNDSGSGFSFTAGQWVRVSGFTGTATNNGWFRVETAAAGKITVSGATLTDETAGDTVTIEGTRLLGNGTNKISYTLEKDFADITEFISFTGMRVGGLTMNIEVGSLITGTMGFLGKVADATAATVFTGGPTAAPTNDVMNVVDNITRVLEGGSGQSGVLRFNFTVNNNLGPLPELGTLGGTDIRLGSVNVTGFYEQYFTSRTTYEKYLDRTETDLGVAVEDAAGKGYAFSFPAVDFTNAQIINEGINGDVTARFDWAAHNDSTFSEMYSITRVGTA